MADRPVVGHVDSERYLDLDIISIVLKSMVREHVKKTFILSGTMESTYVWISIRSIYVIHLQSLTLGPDTFSRWKCAR